MTRRALQVSAYLLVAPSGVTNPQAPSRIDNANRGASCSVVRSVRGEGTQAQTLRASCMDEQHAQGCLKSQEFSLRKAAR
jgi:hypothetical protein